MSTEINARLIQQTRFAGTREYVIVNGKELRIRFQGKFKQQLVAISLLALGEKSSYRIHFVWRWLILTIVSGVLLGGYFLARNMYSFATAMFDFAVVAITGVLLLLGLVLFVVNISRKRVFYARSSHIALFDILVNKPNQREYRAFLDSLQGYINKARQFWSLKTEQQLAGELRMIRRLVSEGVLEQAQYELAKDRLFRISNKKSTRAATG